MGQQKCKYCDKTGCYSSKYHEVLCPKHYYQIKKFGNPVNTKYDKNEINIYNDCIGVITTDSQYKKTGEFFIDKESYPLIEEIRWRNFNL